MPEKKKPDKDFENIEEKEITESNVEQSESTVKDSWGADQKEKSYYYDDSYGYEIYNPDNEDED